MTGLLLQISTCKPCLFLLQCVRRDVTGVRVLPPRAPRASLVTARPPICVNVRNQQNIQNIGKQMIFLENTNELSQWKGLSDVPITASLLYTNKS